MAPFVFSMAKTILASLPTNHFVTLKPLFPFRQAQFVRVFLQTLGWSPQHRNKTIIFLLDLSNSRSFLVTLFSSPSFYLLQPLWQMGQDLSFLFSCAVSLQWVPGHSFVSAHAATNELARRPFCLLLFAFCLLPFASYLLPPASCLLPSASCLLSSSFCLLPPAIYLLSSVSCLLPSASCLPPSIFSLLSSVFCLLPPAFFLLPPVSRHLSSVFCLLSSAFCLLPSTFLPPAFSSPSQFLFFILRIHFSLFSNCLILIL